MACLYAGKLAFLAILVSAGVVLQILQACVLYDNWWPLLTVIMYMILPLPLVFHDTSQLYDTYSEPGSGWLDTMRFSTGASLIGSVAIPAIMKHAGIISSGALLLTLSSYLVFLITIACVVITKEEDDYYYTLF